MEEVDSFLSGSIIFDCPAEAKLVDNLVETDEILLVLINEDDKLFLFDKCGVGCHRLVGPHGQLHFCVGFEMDLLASCFLQILFFLLHELLDFILPCNHQFGLCFLLLQIKNYIRERKIIVVGLFLLEDKESFLWIF